jgi:hypothetical protein
MLLKVLFMKTVLVAMGGDKLQSFAVTVTAKEQQNTQSKNLSTVMNMIEMEIAKIVVTIMAPITKIFKKNELLKKKQKNKKKEKKCVTIAMVHIRVTVHGALLHINPKNQL